MAAISRTHTDTAAAPAREAVPPRGRGIPRVTPDRAMLAVTIVFHLVLLLVLFPNTREDVVVRGFLRLCFDDSGRTLTGGVPYRDFLLEYPPGTLLFMLVPRLFATGYLEYRALFFVQVAILNLIVLATLYASARTACLPVARVLGLYTLALILLGPVVDYRLDLAPTALTALAVLAWQRDRPVLAAAGLAAGVATKAYPLLLVPLLLLDQWAQGRMRRAPAIVLAFAATLAAFAAPTFLAGPSSLLRALNFQTGRHLQVESIWATAPLLLHLATGFPLEIVGRKRALVIFGPGDAWGGAGTPALILVAVLVYALWWRLRGRPRSRAAALPLAIATLLLAATILSKVLSPQYLLWVLPAFALLPRYPRRAMLALGAFVVALPLTQWIYPLHYGELVILLMPATVGVLAARNVLLVLALALLLSTLWPPRRVVSPE